MGNNNCLNCLNNDKKNTEIPVEDKINYDVSLKSSKHKVISEEEKLDLSNDNLLKQSDNKALNASKTVNFNFENDNTDLNAAKNIIQCSENQINTFIENHSQNDAFKNNINNFKKSDKNIVSSSNKIVLNRSAKNFTFSKETKTFVNNIIQNNHNQTPVNHKGSSFLNFNNNKISTNSPDEVILQNEFFFNSKMINNQLNRMKTVEVSRNKKYILLTRTHIKLYKNKNIYISYGSMEEEYKLNDIVKCEFINNPFRKMKLYTINFLHGKNNLEFSISSENQSDIETWFKLIKFLMNSSFL